jgi:GxxExxY protein
MGDNKINLVYEDLSRKIIGVLFNLYNTLGYGHPEKTYQKALAVGFQQVGLNFKE